jgi:hypothetical protein
MQSCPARPGTIPVPSPGSPHIPAFLSAVAGINALAVDEDEVTAVVWLSGCGHGSDTAVALLLFGLANC